MAGAGREEFGAWLVGRSPELARLGYLLAGDDDGARALLDTALVRAYRRRGDRDGVGADALVRAELVRAHLDRARWARLRDRLTGAGRRRPPDGSTDGPLDLVETPGPERPPVGSGIGSGTGLGRAVGTDPGAADPVAAPDVDTGTDDGRARAATWAALAGLPPEVRAALVLADGAPGGEPAQAADLDALAAAVTATTPSGHPARERPPGRLLADLLADPARTMADPGDLLARLRARSSRRRRRLTAMAAVAAIGVAATAAVAGSHPATVAKAPAAPDIGHADPPSGRGYLPWAPRGSLLGDHALLAAAVSAWESTAATHQPASTPYVVWADLLSGRRTVVLQGLDAGGNLVLAQLGEAVPDGSAPTHLSPATSAVVVDASSVADSSSLAALVLLDRGALPPTGGGTRPGTVPVALLVAPAQTVEPASGSLQASTISLRARHAPPVSAVQPEVVLRDPTVDPSRVGAAWTPLAVSGGITQTWAAAPGGSVLRVARLTADGYVVSSLLAVPGGVTPQYPPILQYPDAVGGGRPALADPGIYDDGLILVGNLPGIRGPSVVQGLGRTDVTVSDGRTTGTSAGDVATLLLATYPGGPWFAQMDVRAGSRVECTGVRPLLPGPELDTREILGGRCTWADVGPGRVPVEALAVMTWVGPRVARVHVAISAAHRGERALHWDLAAAGGRVAGIRSTSSPATAPTGDAVWTAFDAAGHLVGTWSLPGD